MPTDEPVIVAFCCHYCAYTAADSAGTRRQEYPPNVKILRVPCSGKVDAIHLMQAFEGGADGVLVAGCLDGDCHFKSGNLRAASRVARVREILEEIGIGGERLAMVKLSAGMGERFAAIARETTDRIRGLGPNPVKPPTPATDSGEPRTPAGVTRPGGLADEPSPSEEKSTR